MTFIDGFLVSDARNCKRCVCCLIYYQLHARIKSYLPVVSFFGVVGAFFGIALVVFLLMLAI